MLQSVDLGRRSLTGYEGVAPGHLLSALREVADELSGLRVLHINATPYGGGVSELLRSVVPLLNDVGLVADWAVISGDDAFFTVTKTIHNGLQGGERVLSEADQATYLANAQLNAAAFEEEYDVVFVHDPQPATLLPLRGKGRSRWVWRCHIDTAHPNPDVWAFLRPHLTDYDAAVFTMAEFMPPDLPIPRVEIVPPAIDPISPKNLALSMETARQVVEWLGVRTDQPLVTQVSRFDRWKDPLGVLAAYQQVRREIDNVQLVLAGSLALDDPEGADMYRAIREHAGDDPLIHIFTNLVGVGNIEVNALQMLSDVVIQKSLREGFGLVVSETLWKGTPVVAGRAGGIPLQMADGTGGVLVDGVEACANAVVALLRDRARALGLGASGRERVCQHFLTPRLVLDQLTLMRDLVTGQPIAKDATRWKGRDPVCGMAVGEAPVTVAYDGEQYGFCSERCRARFASHPRRYVRAE